MADTIRVVSCYAHIAAIRHPKEGAALDASRRLGLTVTESCLLNPVKSVTAVIGLSDRPQAARIRGCGYCRMRESCALRKGGRHCGE